MLAGNCIFDIVIFHTKIEYIAKIWEKTSQNLEKQPSSS